MQYNKIDRLRQKIIGFNKYREDGTNEFFDMSLDTLKTLIDNGFADLDKRTNNLPTIREFIELVEKHAETKLSFRGIIVSPERRDYGIYVEGIEAHSNNKEFILDFVNLCYEADEFECKKDYQYCFFNSKVV